MPTGRDTFTDEQIKHMVSRFLAWRLPENFSPDGGISFKPTFNDHMPFGPMKHEPMGTNLFDATQAEAMVRYMIEGMPLAASQQPTDAMVHAGAAALRAIFPALSFEEQADVVLRAALAKASGEPT